MAPKRRKQGTQLGIAVRSSHALPTYDGPKLGKFKDGKAAIRFVDLLSREAPGEDGQVFEVIIKSKRYALKMFNFFDTSTAADDLAGIGVPLEKYIAHCDPFYAECRAYGCIEDHRQNGKIAVGCYGFMAVSAKQEDVLAGPPFEIDPSEWNRPEQEYDLPVTGRQPFRAVVKQLVKSKQHFRHVAQMRKDLLALQGMGVYVQDISKENYINGKLVDFSRSWTKPHLMLDPDIRDQDLIDDQIEGDLLTFERMLQEAGLRTRTETLSTSNTSGRLRPNIKKPDRFGFS